jgi:hypothetical protein
MLLGMFAATIARIEKRRRWWIGPRQRAGPRAGRSITGRCGSCPRPEPARWCRRHGYAHPQGHASGSSSPAASALLPPRPPSRRASTRRDRRLRGRMLRSMAGPSPCALLSHGDLGATADTPAKCANSIAQLTSSNRYRPGRNPSLVAREICTQKSESRANGTGIDDGLFQFGRLGYHF